MEVAGGVIRSKIARAAGGAARSRGLITWSSNDNEVVDELDDEVEEEEDVAVGSDDPWSWDHHSGLPSSMYEIVKAMVDCGFTPSNNAFVSVSLVSLEPILKAYGL